MNILEIEDMIKGLPDQALQREAQMPSGQRSGDTGRHRRDGTTRAANAVSYDGYAATTNGSSNADG